MSGGQRIVIEQVVLHRLNGYRQRFPCSKEAGGQLFGSVSSQEVVVTLAVGPRRQDERTRLSFRSDPHAAQKEIERQHKIGNLYLGEWHTHAEPVPRYSGADRQTIDALVSRSKLNLSSLLLLIRGTATLPQGLAAYFVLRGRLNEIELTVES